MVALRTAPRVTSGAIVQLFVGAIAHPACCKMDKSTQREFIKVTLSEGNQVLCRLSEGRPSTLGRCEKCNFYSLTWYRLLCSHSLCEECFNQQTRCSCPSDEILATKNKATKEFCIHDPILERSFLECPFCSSRKHYKTIADHIRRKHSDMFVQKRTEESEASQKKQSTNRLYPTSDFEEMMADPVFNKIVTEHTSPSSAGQFEVVTPQPPAYKKQDLQKSHQGRRFERNDSGEDSPMRNYVSPSSGVCSGLDVKDTGTPLRVTTTKYERKRSVEIDDDIQEIKTRVKVLQKRLDNIEKPLLEIIERLSRKE